MPTDLLKAAREKPAEALVFALLILSTFWVIYNVARGKKKSGFLPTPISTCSASSATLCPANSRNSAGTVVRVPYSTQSQVSLGRAADSPEIASQFNPITGVGKSALVRSLSDRYRGADAYMRMASFDAADDVSSADDGAMHLTTAVSRRTHPASAIDLDSDYVGGAFDTKEMLTSRRRPAPNTLTGSRVGLGSTRLDPRFEPGPRLRMPGGDYSVSHGGHAGGVTLGGYGDSDFRPAAGWDWNYVHGSFGPEAMATERSLM